MLLLRIWRVALRQENHLYSFALQSSPINPAGKWIAIPIEHDLSVSHRFLRHGADGHPSMLRFLIGN